MGFFSKAFSGAKGFVHKAASGVESIASKASGALHSVNNVMNKIQQSSIGNKILDLVPEGHAVFDAVKGGVGAAERTAHSVGSLAGGVRNLTNSKDLKSAVDEGQRLVKQGRGIVGQAGRDYRQTKSELERTTKPLRDEISGRMRGRRVQVGQVDESASDVLKNMNRSKPKRRRKKRSSKI